jgi:translation initiation factor IF-2
MTNPTDKKNQRKVLTVAPNKDRERKTLTVPNKNSKDTRSNVRREGLYVSQEDKERRLRAMQLSQQKGSGSIFEKKQIKQILVPKKLEEKPIEPVIETKPPVPVKAPERKAQKPRSHYNNTRSNQNNNERKPPREVNFANDPRKKFRDLNSRPQATTPVIKATPAPIQPKASPTKEVEKKKLVKKYDRDEERLKKKQKLDAQTRFSAAHLARIDSDDGAFKFKKKKNKASNALLEKIARDLVLSDVITVSELASRLSEKAGTIIKTLLKMGVVATLNQVLDADTAELVARELGHRVERKSQEDAIQNLMVKNEGNLIKRPPIVTVMGHVDHGKTSLLDSLRKSDVAAGEAGGITQHIGAYSVQLPDGDKVTFLDTPGHEAFSAMRMRGAKVTDIIILVVAADDGIKAQTIEAISHAKAAQVPIIVAINKIDKVGANFDNVKQTLLNYDLIPDDLGGDVMVVGVSALKRIGLDKLLEAVLLQAELLDLKAAETGRANGYVVEARLDKIKGFTASLLVQSGELKVGDIVVAGSIPGKIRSMTDDKGVSVKSAGPSTPVEITGLEEVAVAGDAFLVMPNEKSAKELVTLLKEKQALAKIAKPKTLQEIFADKTGIKEIPLLIKSDVHGSAEAIVHSLQKIENPELKINILHYGAGGINESDVMLAATSKAMILGFNVRPNPKAKELASKLEVEIRFYSIIYQLIDDVKSILGNLLSPIQREEILGLVEVRRIFETSKYGKIAGSYVKEGIVKRNAAVRIIRDNQVLYTSKIKSLKRQQDDIKEAKEGFECGIILDNYDDLKLGDQFEIFEIISEKKTL